MEKSNNGNGRLSLHIATEGGGLSSSPGHLESGSGRTSAHALDFLVASMIHDLRSPLAVASGAAWTLKDAACPSEEREYWTDCVLRNLTALQYLLEDFRDHLPQDGVSGETGPQLVPVDLATLVRPIVQDYAAVVKSHVFQLRCATAPVHGDAVQLGRLVFNLLSNAARYSPSGTIVHIVVDQVQDGDETVSLLRVSDSGPGISKEELASLYQPWLPGEAGTSAHAAPGEGGPTGSHTRRRGLGLSSVRRIADMHGAEIRVQTAPGQGSAFEVLFRPGAEL